MSQHEPSPNSAGVSLQAQVEELRSRCEAVSRLQGGSTYLYEDIAEFFTSTGWKRFTIDGNVAFFDPGRGIAISDTHRGNIILMDDGLFAPIDLRVQHLSGALLDTVAKLCR